MYVDLCMSKNLLKMKHLYLFIALIFLVAGIIIETKNYNTKINEEDVAQFEQQLNAEILKAKDECASLLLSARDKSSFSATIKVIEKKKTNNVIQLFENNELIAWNKNQFTNHTNDENGIYFNSNHWFYLVTEKKDNYQCKVFIPIKSEYEYENKFLKNAFFPAFDLHKNVKLSFEKQENSYEVTGINKNSSLCYIDDSFRSEISIYTIQLIFILYISFAILLFIWISNQLNTIRSSKRYLYYEFIAIVVIGCSRFLLHQLEAPYVCFKSELFGPTVYASSTFLPSIGDLIIHTIIFCYVVSRIKVLLNIYLPKKKYKFISLAVWAVSVAGFFFYFNYITHSLIYDSNIELKINNILDLSLYGIAGITVITAILFCFVQFIAVPMESCAGRSNWSKAIFIFGMLLSYSIIALFGEREFLGAIWILLCIVGVYILFQKYNVRKGSLMALVTISIVASGVINIIIFTESSHKDEKLALLYSRNLSNERDPLAEMIIKDIEGKLAADKQLKKLTRYTDYTNESVKNYIKRKYFSGFLNKYELEATICGQTENFSPSNYLENCINFYQPIVEKHGIVVPGSNFYFLDNQNGSISYLGTVSFIYEDESTVDIYIELNLKLTTEELGYPELLLADAFHKNKVLSGFSYAKYSNADLISQKGDFNYPMRFSRHFDSTSVKYSYHSKGWEHYVFKASDSLTVLVSKEAANWYDLLVALSYVFGIFIAFYLPKQLIGKNSPLLFAQLNLQKKIQFSLFALLFTSLFLIAGVMLYLNFQQYQTIEYDHAREKLQSVTAKAYDKFAIDDEESFRNNSYLEYTLSLWSNIFFTDINFYGLDGKLLASSRPEIFEQGLTGDYMPSEAYLQMNLLKQKQFVHHEYIGDMKYISAYSVLLSDRGEPLGYINLPYFTKQKEQNLRVTGLISALLNIYVLLILLASIAAALTADRLTKPLQLLKQKISDIKLGSKNEPIVWKSADELGDIITSYNQMLAKLEESAGRLAESERKNAWQKIARQIAHEIKNPLTPMKLNLQFLQRAWQKQDERFEERLHKISESMIEQINSLAATANEFSNLAKISDIKREEIDIVSLVDKAVVTFEKTPDITFKKEYSCDETSIVGDNDKLIRVFNNIIKNAIQAIPEGKEGVVKIAVMKMPNTVQIDICDNGKGVDPELMGRLFEPNFTTKSSGMGLGLAICKNIIDSLGGRIWFESEQNEGTCFHLELLLWDE